MNALLREILRYLDNKMLIFWIIILGGLYSIFCAVMNYNWFIESKAASIFLKLFGRTGTRIFYVIVGLLAILFAILAYINGQV